MGTIDELTSRRDELTSQLRTLAAKAEARSNGVFTDAEISEVGRLKADLLGVTGQLDRLKSLKATTDEVNALLDGVDGGDFRDARLATVVAGRQERVKSPSASRFGREITRRVFGGDGTDRKALTPLDAPSGSAAVPVAIRRGDGGDVLVLPSLGARVLDLVQRVEIGSGPEYAFVVQGVRDEATAEFVPTLQPKPEVPFHYERRVGRFRVVAALSQPVPRQDLSDIPSLAADIGNELALQIELKTDRAILVGDSDADPESWDGILATEGVRQVEFRRDAVTSVRDAQSALEVDGYQPTAVVLNPTDWANIETTRDTTERYLGNGPFALGPDTLWGVGVRTSNAVPAGQVIVGDWRGALFALRNSLDVSWSDAAGFETNSVRFRAEWRADFQVTHPAAFAVVDLHA